MASPDRNTAVKIAHWYYEEGNTQEEIARKLGFSRQRVNKIISSLVKDGVVSIVIHGLENGNVPLESKLERAFKLEQVVIADSAPGESAISATSKKAAAFLDGYIRDGMTVGVSWGSTLGATIRAMRTANKPGCHVVQLVGGMESPYTALKPDEITRMLARRLGCDYSMLYAPAILDSEQARRILSEQDVYKDAFGRISKCDVALVGVGQLDQSATLVTLGYLNRQDLFSMVRQGYVGDICFNHYRADGGTGGFTLSSRVMGVGLDTLKQIPTVVALAGGEDKAEAVLGALNTGCVNVLLTDGSLARRLEQIIDNDKVMRGLAPHT